MASDEMRWQRFVAAMTLLRACVRPVPDADWRPRVRRYWQRLQRYDDAVVLRVIQDAGNRGSGWLPTLADLDTACQREQRRRELASPALPEPPPGATARERGCRWLAHVIDGVARGEGAAMVADPERWFAERCRREDDGELEVSERARRGGVGDILG